jgi:hypothetical protein
MPEHYAWAEVVAQLKKLAERLPAGEKLDLMVFGSAALQHWGMENPGGIPDSDRPFRETGSFHFIQIFHVLPVSLAKSLLDREASPAAMCVRCIHLFRR